MLLAHEISLVTPAWVRVARKEKPWDKGNIEKHRAPEELAGWGECWQCGEALSMGSWWQEEEQLERRASRPFRAWDMTAQGKPLLQWLCLLVVSCAAVPMPTQACCCPVGSSWAPFLPFFLVLHSCFVSSCRQSLNPERPSSFSFIHSHDPTCCMSWD